jgi:hypothetical protein
MLRSLGLAVVLALGLCGSSVGSASAAVVQPGIAADIAQAADAAPAVTTPVWHYGRPHYRPYRPYYRPYRPYYRPYRYGYGPRCRWVSRRVWTPYGWRWVQRRVCRGRYY